MTSRLAYTIIFAILSAALACCAFIASRSRKSIGKTVALLEMALIPPVLGNMLIIASGRREIALLGCYIYFIGWDCVMFSLLHFTAVYCKGCGNGQKIPAAAYLFLALDSVQLLLNTVFGHAFDIEPILVDGYAYYRLVPLFGQTWHRITVYGVLAAIMLVYAIIIFRMPRIYREQYSIILISMIVVCILESFYIFSRSPIDRSMIGLSGFGLVTFYFTLYYRPHKLLDRMLSDFASDMPDSLFMFDPSGRCIWANATGCELIGIHSEEEYEHAVEKLTALFGTPEQTNEEINVRRAVGTGDSKQYFSLAESKVMDENRRLTGSYLRVRNVTDEHQEIKRRIYDATHDRLTGLYTREYLYTQISERLASDPATQYYVLFLNIKNFKVVNDVFGTDFGDYAIQRIAQWIESYAHIYSIYGRLGGDTFGALVRKEDFCAEELEQALGSFRIKRNETQYHVLLQLGVYEISAAERDISVMFDRAHLALSTLKEDYHSHISFYNEEIRQKLLWNQEISAQLDEAVRAMQLRPYLQPIADGSGKIVGAEALVRWIHPKHGFLSPAAFIPVFEKNGMIIEVDRHMWRCACEILARWKHTHPDMFISVNISPKDFYFIDVVAEIQAMVKEYDLDPKQLRIEITETVMMNDAENRMTILNAFRELGFLVEMDDFGSGYSSLNMLKDMPVDVLKIDMKFLGRTKDQDKANTIVRNIIKLSQELGIASLTEGVETQTQYEALSDMGCKLFQGYYFAKPMPVDEFESFAGIA